MAQLRLFLASFLVCVVLAVNPGLRIQINQKALDYVKSKGVGLMNEKLQGFHIPDITGYQATPSNAIFSYSLTQIFIHKFDIPDSQSHVTLHAPSNVKLQVGGLVLKVTANYHVTILGIGKKGSIEAVAKGTSILADVELKANDGKPQVEAQTCKLDLDKLDIDVKGNLLDDIVTKLANLFKNLLAKTICSQVTNLVDKEANKQLGGIPTSEELAEGFNIDYSLVGEPEATSSHIAIPMRARIWYKGHHDDAGIPKPAVMPTLATNDHMICASVEVESLIGSAGYAAHVSNFLHYQLDKSVLQKYKLSPKFLDCNCRYLSCIGKLLPELIPACAGGTIEILLSSTEAPVAHVNPSGAHISMTGNLHFQARHQNKSVSPLFTAHLTLSAVVPSTVRFEGWSIKGEIFAEDATVSIASSHIGPVDQKGLEFTWEMLVAVAVEEELDRLASAGIKLPQIPYIDVLNPKLSFGQKELQVCFDAKYNGKL